MASSNAQKSSPSVEIENAIRRNPVLKAALCHRSARAQALTVLGKNDFHPAILEYWLDTGKALVAVYAARAVITAVQTGSAGEASLMMKAVTSQLEMTLAEAIQASKLACFGEAMPQNERLSPAAYIDIAYRLVGCHGFLQGYQKTIIQLLRPLAPLEGLKLHSRKDPKTSLQELTQKRRLGVPEYKLIKTVGPAHSQIFRVAVSVTTAGWAEGEGRSKRLAEQAAAQAFIDKNYRSFASTHAVIVRPEFDISAVAAKLPKLPNTNALETLSNQLEIPEWGSNLLSLALVHRSYANRQSNNIFGKDNQLLAFLGSYVLQWAVRDYLIKDVGVQAVADAGGISALSAASLASEKLGSAYPEILDPSLLLLGKGEKALVPSQRAEFVQAVTGALFLSREELLDTSLDLFKHASSLIAYFGDLAKSKKSRENTLSPKTLFQERCQAIGASIEYETKTSKCEKLVVETAVRLRSRRENSRDLKVSFPAQRFDAHAFPGKSVLEIKVANTLIDTFDQVCGGSKREPGSTAIFSKNVQHWLLNCLLQEVHALQATNDQLRLSRLAKSDIAGFGSLRRNDFGTFEEWIRHVHTFVDEDDSRTIDALSNLYSRAYRDEDSKRLVALLLNEIERLQAFLKNIDPLTSQNRIQDTPHFSSVVQFATAFKIFSRQTAQITLSEFFAQAEILFRRRGCTIEMMGCESENIIEIQGAHLGLLELLARCSEDFGVSECKITISAEGNMLVVQLEKPPAIIADYRGRLSGNSMWLSLSRLLPINAVIENSSQFKVLVPSIVSDKARILAINYWLAYNQRGALDRSGSDSIAILLHDMKNELLAFDEAASRARKSNEKRERYQFAADASSHLDQAMGKVVILRSLARSTNSFDFEPVEIEQFLRSFIQETWSRIPAGIVFTPPKAMLHATIWTNETGLRSILVNLVRNSLEALNDHGRLNFDYTVDSVRKIVRFELIDSGGGFLPHQLSSLNRGLMIESTKRSGPGIGLLTVLLLTNELCGRVEFFVAPSGTGSRIVLEIPSIEPLDNNLPLVSSVDGAYSESAENEVIA